MIAVPLFADGADWIRIAFFLTIGAIWLFNHFVANWREQAKRAAQKPQAPQPRPNRPAGMDPAKEVEEFLRRVARVGQQDERPAQQKPAPLQRPQRESNLPGGETKRRKPQRPAPQTQQRSRQPPQQPRPQQSLRERHLESDVAQRRVSSQVEQADERALQQVQQHLDRVEGNIPADPLLVSDRAAEASATTGPAPTLARAATPGADLAALLGNAANIRQAIVLNEILRRPEERWS